MIMTKAVEKRKRYLELEKARSELLTPVPLLEALSNASGVDPNGPAEQPKTTGITRWQSIKRALTGNFSEDTTTENDINTDKEQD